MPEPDTGRLMNEQAILAEFAGPEAELAEELLKLRRQSTSPLRNRVLALPRAGDPSQPVRPRPGMRPHMALLRGLVIALVLVAGVVAAIPALRVKAVQAAQELAQMFVGLATSPSGFVTFTPPPPFIVQQPDHLSDGWRLVAQRYAPGGQAGSSVSADPGLPSSASSSLAASTNLPCEVSSR